jgi:hypothetical protein
MVTKHFFKRRKKTIGLTPSFCFKLIFASIFVIAILPHTTNSQRTFFQPFINGFNQFTTRLNPFAPQQQQTRPPGPQQFQNFNAVPVQSQQQQQQPPQQSTGSQFPPPGQNLRQNFQTIRFPSGQVVSQNQQFGVISNTNPSVQQQFPGFNSQQFSSQPQAPPQQQQPQQQTPFAGFDSSDFAGFSQTPQQRFPPSQDGGLS